MMEKQNNVPRLRFPEFTGNWVVKKLGELTENGFSNGAFNDPKKVGQGYRIINVKDMYVDGTIDVNTLTKVAIDEKEFLKNRVEYGDIFFTRSSLVKEGIAHSNVNLNIDDDLTFDGHLIRMRPIRTLYSSVFLYYNFSTIPSREQFIRRGKTTTMTTIGQEDIASVEITTPSLPEQQKIATFLSSVDEKLQGLKKKKSLLEAYKKGMMQRLFSQTLRFKDENGEDFPEWEEKTLGDYINVISGIALKGEEITENKSGTPILRGINITEGYIRHSSEIDRFFLTNDMLSYKKFLLKETDIVLGMDGSKVGKNVSLIGFADAGSILIQRVARIRATDKSDIHFIYQSIYSKSFQDYVDVVNTSSGIPHISLQQIKDYELSIPSLPEQTKIANFLSAIDEKIAKVSQEIEQVTVWKKGLLQQMFV